MLIGKLSLARVSKRADTSPGLSPFSLKNKRQSLYCKALWGGELIPWLRLRERGSGADKERNKCKVVHY